MTRIYLSVILACVIFSACTKQVAPTPVPLPYPEKTVVKAKPVHITIKREAPPVIVTFAKGSSTLSPADTERLGKLRLRKPIQVTGYASNERGKRPSKVEAVNNYRLSLKRAQAVCAAIPGECTAIAGGETDAISATLDGNRIAGFVP